MKSFFRQLLADDKGLASSKRVFTLFFTILLAAGYICNLVWNMTVDSHFVDAIMVIIVSGFGFTGVEKFAPSNNVPYAEPEAPVCPCQTAKGE